MQTFKTLAFLGAAALSMSAFAAPNNVPSQGADMSAAGTHGQYKLSPDEVSDMQGVFRLADGRRLTVLDRQSKLFIELDGKREELTPVGPNRFVSHDTGTRITFNQVPFADRVVVDQAAH